MPPEDEIMDLRTTSLYISRAGAAHIQPPFQIRVVHRADFSFIGRSWIPTSHILWLIDSNTPIITQEEYPTALQSS
ncbi:hypothetical protein D9757_002572 [Collybiopsis confluens]|uniref:Uncharacterized protein n=1 Tax=Collybiopsis confluens TaxID=2823264 RepID=A0A8H5HWB0_9AGAR|nr:hypothetical protein D9757_002572 [Collybiopsis confluens]